MTDQEDQTTKSTVPIPLFGVIAEIADRSKQLVLLDLPFSRLIDDIIKPYDQDEAFFIDGVPVTKNKITRIKIVKFGPNYGHAMWELKRGLTQGTHQENKVYGDQYETRFEHILRTNTEDVTSQIIKAYNQAVKPSIKDYLPKREELISAATQLFIQAMKSLAT